jgi:hypothetical protein
MEARVQALCSIVGDSQLTRSPALGSSMMPSLTGSPLIATHLKQIATSKFREEAALRLVAFKRARSERLAERDLEDAFATLTQLNVGGLIVVANFKRAERTIERTCSRKDLLDVRVHHWVSGVAIRS